MSKHCDWTMCNERDCVACYPQPPAPTWAVGDEVLTPAGETGVIVVIRGPHAWVNGGLSQHIWPLAELTRPVPRRKTVTVVEYRTTHGSRFWSEVDPTYSEAVPTGRTHTFETEDET
jgi:hypothetical protein